MTSNGVHKTGHRSHGDPGWSVSVRTRYAAPVRPAVLKQSVRGVGVDAVGSVEPHSSPVESRVGEGWWRVSPYSSPIEPRVGEGW